MSSVVRVFDTVFYFLFTPNCQEWLDLSEEFFDFEDSNSVASGEEGYVTIFKIF